MYMWEVEDVVFDDPGKEAKKGIRKKHGARIMIKGRTTTGSSLIIFLKPVDSSEGIWMRTTAWLEKQKGSTRAYRIMLREQKSLFLQKVRGRAFYL